MFMGRDDKMIDRIQDNNYYSGNKNYGKKVSSNTETFSMDYSGRESVKKQDLSQEKEEVNAKEVRQGDDSADKGVFLELSQPKNDSKSATETIPQQPEKMSDLIPQRLKNLFRDIKAAFIRFFMGSAVEREEQEEIAAVQEMSDLDAKEMLPVSPLQATTDKEQVFDSENVQLNRSLTKAEEAYRAYAKMQEERTLARNSDLLTTYNKQGSFVKMNEDDKNRILHAHPHQIDETF